LRGSFRGEAPPAAGSLRSQIAEGFRWLWGQPLIRTMAFITGGVNFAYAATPLLMIVLAKRLGASDIDIGMMFTIGGLGGVVGSLLGGRVQRRFSFGEVIVFVVCAQALLFPLYLAAPSVMLLGVVRSEERRVGEERRG